MATNYTRNGFIRQADNGLLAAYLAGQGGSPGLDIAKQKARDADPIIQAIDQLPDEQLGVLDRDFPLIASLASEAGLKEIRAQAHFFGRDLYDGLGKQKSRLNAAFWTFLNHRDVFDGAQQFAMPHLSGRYWKRALPVRSAPGSDLASKAESLNDELRGYFRGEEGRGKSCKVEYAKRPPLHQFYCYPEDFPDAPLAWDRGRLAAHYYRPAFEVVFVYDEIAGTVDVYFEGSKQGAVRLWKLFAETVVGVADPPEPAEVAYRLDGMDAPDFSFVRPVGGPIKDVRLKRLAFTTRTGRSAVISIETDVSRDPLALQGEVGRLFVRGGPVPGRRSLSEMKVIGAKVQAVVDLGDGKRPRTRTFDLTETTCSLAHDEIAAALRQVLIDSGIDQTADAKGVGSGQSRSTAELAAE